MDRKEILNYAIKGLESEISAIESKIDRGYNVIDKINRNVAKTKKDQRRNTWNNRKISAEKRCTYKEKR